MSCNRIEGFYKKRKQLSSWRASGSSIKRWLARRTSLPSTMDPKPLVRVTADKIFDQFCVASGIRDGVGIIVTSANGGDHGFEVNAILAEIRIPNGKGRHDRSISSHCEPRNARGGRGRVSEEIHELAFTGQHIGIHEYAYGVPFA